MMRAALIYLVVFTRKLRRALGLATTDLTKRNTLLSRQVLMVENDMKPPTKPTE